MKKYKITVTEEYCEYGAVLKNELNPFDVEVIVEHKETGSTYKWSLNELILKACLQEELDS